MDDTCVCCGEYVVEGRMVCEKCENKYLDESKIMIDKLKEY